MNEQPDMTVMAPAGPVRAVAIVFHGGRVRSHEPVSPRQLSVLRMIPFARSLHRAGGPDGLAVWLPRFTVRGWNGPEMSPVPDARRFIDEVRRRHGDVPVHLVGHSMGGRTALRVAGDDLVGSVVALAPWVPEDEPVEQLAGRRVLIVHGTRDRITDPALSLAYAARAVGAAADLRRVEITGDTHAMLRRGAIWHRLTTAFVLDPGGTATDGRTGSHVAINTRPGDIGKAKAPSDPDPVTNVLAKAASGNLRLSL